MNLQQEWNKLQETNLAPPPLPEAEIRAALHQRSRAPLAGVERVIKYRLYAVVAYLLLALGFMAYNWPFPEKFPIALIILGYYIVALLFSTWQLRHLRQTAVNMDGNLLHTLAAYFKMVKSSIRLDALAGWFVYPMSFALGFFYALIRPDRGVLEVLQTPKLMIPLVLGMMVITPLFWWFNRIINQKMFGNLLEQLKENIEALSA